MKSDLFTLKQKDAIKSFVMAVGTPVIYMVQELIPGWNADPILKAGISATIAYLLKNFFTDSIKQANLTLDNEGITRVYSAEEIKAKESLKT